MRGRFIRKSLLLLCLLMALGKPVYVQAESEESVKTETQDDSCAEKVEIPDEPVPLDLVGASNLVKYKRDLVIMIFIGTLVVTTTVVATIKENRERKKLN